MGSTILSAFDYGELCAVSNDMLEEIGRVLTDVTANNYLHQAVS